MSTKITLVYDKYDSVEGEWTYGMVTSFDIIDDLNRHEPTIEGAVHRFFTHSGEATTLTYLKEYEFSDMIIVLNDFYYNDTQIASKGHKRYIKCSNCDGDGTKTCSSCYGSGNGAYGGECTKCEGMGVFTCKTCGGKGYS